MSLTVLFAATAIAVAPPPVQSNIHRIDFSVPSSAGDLAVNRLAAQAGVSVVVTIDLSTRRTAHLSGRYTIDEAFDRLLSPVGARIMRIGPGAFRVEALPPRSPARPTPRPPFVSPPTQVDDVVVTAPVRRGGLEDGGGRSSLDDAALARSTGRASTETIADLSVSVDSTRQGTGRNKLFVRGVADSALSGPLQATVGQYFGDFRLGFGTPDPDFALIDIRRISVFEGPQGSRFGSGAIGGVIRIEPEYPDPAGHWGRAAVGVSATRGGAIGSDAAFTLNQPTGMGGAVRLVAYGRREGGFVDNPVRGVNDADAVDVLGARLAYRLSSADWTLDVLAMNQTVSAADTPLTRNPSLLENDKALAQPYEGRHALAGVAISRRFAQMRTTTAASVSRQILDETFEASEPATGLAALTTRVQSTKAASFESRVELDLGPLWTLNGGVSLAQAETRSVRTLLPAETGVRPPGRVDLARRYQEAAVFGEMVFRPVTSLSVAIGGRLAKVGVQTRISSEPESAAASPHGGVDLMFTPTIGLDWTPPWGWRVFGRYEEGIRPGAVSELRGFGRPYRHDRIRLLEAGLRTPPGRALRLKGSLGLVHWRDIQSDAITVGGDLVTDNIGDGRIVFTRLAGAWDISDALHLSGGLFLNHSRLRLSGPSLIGAPEGDIPNVAPVSAQAGVAYGPVRVGRRSLSLAGNFRYVGRSRPGLGPGLDRLQGGYWNTDLSARLESDRQAIVITISNPFDIAATRFAIGAPYRLYDGGVVPLRPFTLRLGVETRF